jgi:hypothetical protein
LDNGVHAGGVAGAAALIVIETDSVMSDELAVIVDDADVLLEFYRYPAEH